MSGTDCVHVTLQVFGDPPLLFRSSTSTNIHRCVNDGAVRGQPQFVCRKLEFVNVSMTGCKPTSGHVGHRLFKVRVNNLPYSNKL